MTHSVRNHMTESVKYVVKRAYFKNDFLGGRNLFLNKNLIINNKLRNNFSIFSIFGMTVAGYLLSAKQYCKIQYGLVELVKFFKQGARMARCPQNGRLESLAKLKWYFYQTLTGVKT